MRKLNGHESKILSGNEGGYKMNTLKFENDMERNLYCSLLPLAYEVQKEQTGGFVSGTGAENIRNKMYQAIKEANIL